MQQRRQSFWWWKFWCLSCGPLAILLGCVAAQYDYTLVCEPGYRVTRFARSPQYNGQLGALIVQCEIIEPNKSKVECTRLLSAPQCAGIPEGCSGQTWLAGFHAYEIENTTKAVLLDPICCGSPYVEIDERSCVRDRINQANAQFDHRIADDLAYRGIQCWHQYNENNVLFDIIWKAEICSFRPERDTAPAAILQACSPCECDCGKEKCINGNHSIRLIHKNFNNRLCECRCDCTHYC